MHLVQLLLPVTKAPGQARDEAGANERGNECGNEGGNERANAADGKSDDAGYAFTDVHRALSAELTARFGGVTAYSRSPAHGVWQPDAGGAEHDDIVLLEVVVETLDADWWRDLRQRLERDLEQDSILVRAIAIQML
ncbi:MAG TPA: hypothetical protein VE869_02960 [Gemmatimonas sp.]|nr:hypothetical protein [Gemmatimonas sp.]